MTAIGIALVLALAGAPKGITSKKSQLKIDVKPAAALIYVDGKKRGTGATVQTLRLTPGDHTIKIVHNKDEHEEIVGLKSGQTLNWKWAFEDDRPQAHPTLGEKEAPPEGKSAEVPR